MSTSVNEKTRQSGQKSGKARDEMQTKAKSSIFSPPECATGTAILSRNFAHARIGKTRKIIQLDTLLDECENLICKKAGHLFNFHKM